MFFFTYWHISRGCPPKKRIKSCFFCITLLYTIFKHLLMMVSFFSEGFPCPVIPALPSKFSGVSGFPASLNFLASFTQTFTCVGPPGVPFDTIMGHNPDGGLKLNSQTLTCSPTVQGSTISFTTGHSIDIDRFSCLRKFIYYSFFLICFRI